MKKRRKILLSCYACSPVWGSEPGVGWRWLLELTKTYDIVLLTHSFFQEQIEPIQKSQPINGLEIYYCNAPAFGLHVHTQLNSRIFYVWWQWHLRHTVKWLMTIHSFDLFHHLTWGTFRFPVFLGRMGVPLVMGPLGGGEVAPYRFYKGLPFSTRAFEWVRYFSLMLGRFDLLGTWGPRASTLILCKTQDTIHALPKFLQQRTALALEIGAPPVDARPLRNVASSSKSFQLLFAGKLSGVKGITLALGALHKLVNNNYDVVLQIAGQGPLREFLSSEIERLTLSKHVQLIGMVSREELLKLYSMVDLFVFPSLHDSSGNVVLESISRGLPVICLDLGGPKYYINTDCGVVIPTLNQSVEQVEQLLAAAIANLIDNPSALRELSIGAYRQASIQTWQSRVEKAYELISERLDWVD